MKIPSALLALFGMTCSQVLAAEPLDLVIANGRVMDPASGLEAPRHVGVRSGKIVVLSETPLQGALVVDAAGSVVAPGFIDLHAHGQTTTDLQIKAQDGVTTALEMEGGVSPVSSWYASMEGKAPIHYGATVGHISARFAAFHPELKEAPPSLRRAGMAKLGPNPAGANQPAGAVEMQRLLESLNAGLDEGALGIGVGINYTPGATVEEIEQVFRLAAARKVPVFVHTRAFGIGAIREAIDIARKTRASLHIVHVGSSGLSDVPEVLRLIDAGRAEGLDLTTEVYPYTAASTRLESAMFNPGWQENLRISHGDIVWAATGERLTAATFETYRKEGGWVIMHMMKDGPVEMAIAHPGVMIASDGVPFVDGKGHPRGAGTYARVLGRYVREKKLLPLMEALAKMTLLPARRLEGHVPSMRSKGRIAIGADADITVFDPAKIIDRATFEAPTTPSTGISQVIVGGEFVVRDGALVKEARPGRSVRLSR